MKVAIGIVVAALIAVVGCAAFYFVFEQFDFANFLPTAAVWAIAAMLAAGAWTHYSKA